MSGRRGGGGGGRGAQRRQMDQKGPSVPEPFAGGGGGGGGDRRRRSPSGSPHRRPYRSRSRSWSNDRGRRVSAQHQQPRGGGQRMHNVDDGGRSRTKSTVAAPDVPLPRNDQKSDLRKGHEEKRSSANGAGHSGSKPTTVVPFRFHKAATNTGIGTCTDDLAAKIRYAVDDVLLLSEVKAMFQPSGREGDDDDGALVTRMLQRRLRDQNWPSDYAFSTLLQTGVGGKAKSTAHMESAPHHEMTQFEVGPGPLYLTVFLSRALSSGANGDSGASSRSRTNSPPANDRGSALGHSRLSGLSSENGRLMQQMQDLSDRRRDEELVKMRKKSNEERAALEKKLAEGNQLLEQAQANVQKLTTILADNNKKKLQGEKQSAAVAVEHRKAADEAAAAVAVTNSVVAVGKRKNEELEMLRSDKNNLTRRVASLEHQLLEETQYREEAEANAYTQQGNQAGLMAQLIQKEMQCTMLRNEKETTIARYSGTVAALEARVQQQQQSRQRATSGSPTGAKVAPLTTEPTAEDLESVGTDVALLQKQVWNFKQQAAAAAATPGAQSEEVSAEVPASRQKRTRDTEGVEGTSTSAVAGTGPVGNRGEADDASLVAPPSPNNDENQ